MVFHGETDEEFNKTYEFLKRIKHYKTHVFKYSPKRGTVAEKMKDQILPEIKEERSNKLLELSDKFTIEYNKSIIGSVVKVLFEEADDKYFKGHTANYLYIKVPLHSGALCAPQENMILDVKVTSLDGVEIIGELV